MRSAMARNSSPLPPVPRARTPRASFASPRAGGLAALGLAALLAGWLAPATAFAAQCVGNTTMDFNDGQLDYRLYTAKDAACASMSSSVIGGRLSIVRPSGIGSNCAMSANLAPGLEICGDFDIRLDFDLVSFPTPASGRARYATMYVWDQCGGGYVGIERFLASSAGTCLPYANSYKIFQNVTDACVATYVPTNHASGKFRIARTGTTWNVYFWTGSAWTLARTTTGGTGPVGVSFYTGGNSPEAQEVRFDNLEIQSESSVACQPVPTAPCLPSLQDDFNDGALAPRWMPSASCGSPPTESGGEMVLARGACVGNIFVSVDPTRETICGDFDLTVDYRLENFTTPSAGSRYASLSLLAQSGGHVAVIERYARFAAGDCTPSTQNYKSFTSSSLNCNSSMVPTTDQSGKFRVTRVGCLVTTYYHSGGAWVPLMSRNSSRDPVRIEFYTGTDASATPHTVAFDNLWVTATPPASCAVPPTGSCTPPPPGMISWWPGDGDAADIEGSNEGAQVGGGFVPGRVGQAFSFGGNDYVTLPSLAATSGGAFTVDAWFRSTATPSQINAEGGAMTIYSEGNGSVFNPVFQLYLNSSGQVRFFHRDNAGVTASGGSTTAYNDGLWHHASVVKEAPGSRRIYVDGVLTGTSATTLGATTVTNARIGGLAQFNHTPQEFIGAIDEVEVFNRALTASEIQAIVAAGSAGKCKDSGPPVVVAPADTGYSCAAQVPAASPGQASATDDRGVVSLTVAEASNGGAGSPASPLVLTRTWTATDAAGNVATDEQVITVVDDTAPVLSLPADVTAVTGPGTEPCAEVRIELSIGAATATDNCSEPVVAVSGVPGDGRFPVGETVLTWSATDAAGNVATGTQRVTVACPVGDLAGSATLACNGQSQPAAGLTVRLLHEGVPFRSTTTGSAGDYRFDDLRLGTYTVDIDPPPGYGIGVDVQLVTLSGDELELQPFAFTCLLSDLVGQVLGSCNGSGGGLQGVTVDLYREEAGSDVLVGTTATDASGHYRFDDVALGDYSVVIVLPLGYSAGSSSHAVTLATPDGVAQAATFSLTCQPIAAQPRSMGYWKHQVNVYLTGKGSAQETLAQMLGSIDAMVAHFNQNLVNPVVVYVPGAAATNDKLLQLQQLLTVNKGGTMLDRAKQQLLSLLLNVVSGKISQTHAISAEGATVSQAITHAHDLIVDGNPANDETAKTIADLINNGQIVPDGVVPVGTRVITYNQRRAPRDAGAPLALALGPIAPNPALVEATVTFALPSAAPAVLELHDLAGRLLAREEVGSRGSGVHTLRLRDLGALRPGVYVVRLAQGRDALVRRIAVIR